MGRDALIALGIMAVMVLLLATGLVPAAVAGILAAGAMLLFGILNAEEIYRVDQLDDGDPRRRDDAALDRDHRDRRGAAPRRRGSSTSSAASGRGRSSPGSSC